MRKMALSQGMNPSSRILITSLSVSDRVIVDAAIQLHIATRKGGCQDRKHLVRGPAHCLPIAKPLENTSYGTNMEKTTLSRPLLFYGGPCPANQKKEPGPSCEGPGMIRPVVPGAWA